MADLGGSPAEVECDAVEEVEVGMLGSAPAGDRLGCRCNDGGERTLGVY